VDEAFAGETLALSSGTLRARMALVVVSGCGENKRSDFFSDERTRRSVDACIKNRLLRVPRGKGGLVQLTPTPRNTCFRSGSSGRGASGQSAGLVRQRPRVRPGERLPPGRSVRSSSAANSSTSSASNGGGGPVARNNRLCEGHMVAAIAPELGQQHPPTVRSATGMSSPDRRHGAALIPLSQRKALWGRRV